MARGNEKTHPSYGLVQIIRSNSNNGRNFFGSSYKPLHYFTLSIYSGSSSVDEFGHVHYHRAKHLEKHSIRLTPHQFAELITSPNVGEGVPCTIEREGGVRIQQEEDPIPETKTQIAIQVAKDKIREAIKEQKETQKALVDKIKSAKIPKGLQSELVDALVARDTFIAGNLDFYLRQIVEVGDQVTADMKANIDATITGTVIRLGEKALGERILNGQALQLTTKE